MAAAAQWIDEPVYRRFIDKYGAETALELYTAQQDEGLVVSGTPRERFEQLEAALTVILPDTFYTDIVENESLNHVFSLVDHAASPGPTYPTPDALYEDVLDQNPDEIGAVVLDHCAVYDVLDRRNRDSSYTVVRDELLPGAYTMPWYGTLLAADLVADDPEIPLLFPSDLYTETAIANNPYRNTVLLDYLAETGTPFKTYPPTAVPPDLSAAADDLAIVDSVLDTMAHEGLDGKPLFITNDSDYADIQAERDILVASPDMARYLLWERA